ncbi:MAG TPA: SBBP repeat-containing protein [Bryobacteraceae bacterium]|nr:SBBP repeat-containing protein [Bryobacteraceae bacterium]
MRLLCGAGHRFPWPASFLPVFSALLLVTPLFAAAGGGATVIDSAGNVWRTGQANLIETTATAFQKTAVSSVCATENPSPFQGPIPVYCQHAYLIKQDPSGNVLYATYLGGSSQDGATAITTDALGNVYVTGYTYSADFPVTTGVVQSTNAGPLTPAVVMGTQFPYGPTYVAAGGDVFVAKFASDGALLFSTLVGGSGSDVPSLIAADSSGSVYVSGATASTDFPLTAGAITRQATTSFFLRLNANGTTLTYSTYSAPSILAFDVDNQGRAYLTGDFAPPSSSVTSGPYVTIVDTQRGTVLNSTYLPAIAPEIAGAGLAIAVNAEQNLFLAVSPAPLPADPRSNLPPFRPLGAGYFLELSSDGRILAETDISQTRLDSLLLDASGNAYAFGRGTGAIPATAPQMLALPCSPDGGAFVLQSNPAGSIVAATYFRQGDDTALSLTSPGHLLLYRTRSSTTVPLDLTIQPPANFGCPKNLASNTAAQGLAPGEVFVLTGYDLGPAQGIAAVPNAAGQYPTSLGGVQALFNSKPAPLLFVQANEIHAVAPFAFPDFPVIEVQYGAQSAPPLDISSSTVDPGIFSANGQGAIINQDGTVNTPANPARLGSIVSIYATGLGTLVNDSRSTRNPLADGQVTPIPPPYILTELAYPQVTFAGVAGVTLWSGAAPGLIAGVTQINVQLPAELPSGIELDAVPMILNAAATPSPPVLISVKQ